MYENFAEATSGKGSVLPDSGVNFASDVQNMETEAAEEEAKDKEYKADLARKALKSRIGSQDGTLSAPSGAQLPNPAHDGLEELRNEGKRSSSSEDGHVIGDGEADQDVQARARASELDWS